MDYRVWTKFEFFGSNKIYDNWVSWFYFCYLPCVCMRMCVCVCLSVCLSVQAVTVGPRNFIFGVGVHLGYI